MHGINCSDLRSYFPNPTLDGKHSYYDLGLEIERLLPLKRKKEGRYNN
jgi:hypothetical protein